MTVEQQSQTHLVPSNSVKVENKEDSGSLLVSPVREKDAVLIRYSKACNIKVSTNDPPAGKAGAGP